MIIILIHQRLKMVQNWIFFLLHEVKKSLENIPNMISASALAPFFKLEMMNENHDSDESCLSEILKKNYDITCFLVVTTKSICGIHFPEHFYVWIRRSWLTFINLMIRTISDLTFQLF